ncbi:MAG: hypothetical protein QM727_13600 [Niabella sp.]
MKLNELKPGDRVMIDDDGVKREGTVVRVSHEEQEACIDNGVQEFWYPLQAISGIPLNEEQLLRLGFEHLPSEGGQKYGKGPVRVVALKPDFSAVEVWYREDRRHFEHPIMVHELQNAHAQMTKVPLE